MEQENYENNNDRKIESVYSTRVRAGKRRTYFFDVRATRSNDYFLTITESRKRFDNNGYDRHKVFIYKEDFNKFIKAINEAIDFVKTELMPDFDFDAFNHDEPYNLEESNDANAGARPNPINDRDAAPSQEQPVQANTSEVRVTPPLPINTETASQETPDDKDPIEITEKKPLEAKDTKASEGDNLSGEEVDKW
ncbi:MAG: DUF3276 family protein [Chitinophagaceae bacterium]|nr:DUF3276 family protein [Chitinophagaceae bacterium]